MHIKKLASPLTVIAGLLLAACNTLQPIHNVYSRPIPSNLSFEQATDAIIEAGTYKRWIMTELEPGKIKGEITVRRHRAEILITHNGNQYSIELVDSHMLDRRGNSIHRNYNKWIILLDQEIRYRMRTVR